MRPHSSAKRLGAIIRKCLGEGASVEIEGLGSFAPDGKGGFDFNRETRPQVFIAYVFEDTEKADRLFKNLEAFGFDPWLDRKRLVPGQNWPRAIERAIEVSDYFIACFSRKAVAKRGVFQAELRYALDCASRVPEDDIYFIPVRLDNCKLPTSIADSIQYVDLFPDWPSGMQQIVRMIRRQERRRRRQRLPRAA